jgi:hypothetical protein
MNANATPPKVIGRWRRMGCLPQIGLALVIGVGLIMAGELLFAPWIYVVGGHRRLLPYWAGRGDIQTQAGTYRVYVWFSPSSRSSRILPGTSVSGNGYVCTPRGEGYTLKVSGGTNDRVWKDMDGRSFHLSAYYRPAGWNLTGAPRQPSLSFSGKWQGDTLVMTDDASIAHAFLPDGSLNTRAKSWYPKTGPLLPITFTETSWWLGTPACTRGPQRPSGEGR